MLLVKGECGLCALACPVIGSEVTLHMSNLSKEEVYNLLAWQCQLSNS